MSQQEADFAAVIVKATDAESAKRLAQELQAQGNTANIVAARTAQQSAIKNATGRIQAIRLANNRTDLSELAFAAAESSASTMTDAAVGTPFYAQQGIWVEAVNVSAKQSDSNAQLGYDADANGLSIGYDRQLTDQLLLGAAFTYGKTQADVNGSRDNSDIDTYQLSLYGSYEGETPAGREWLTDAVLNVGHNEHDNERYLDGFSDQAHKASFDSKQVGLRVVSSVGYEHNGWSIAPSLGFNYAKVDLDGYTETSGPAALKVSGQSIEQVELGAGVSTRRSFDVAAGKLEPYAGVMAWHDFNNDALSSTSQFALGGNSFTSADADTSANRVQVNLGASLQVNEQTNLGFGFEHNKSGSLKSNQWNLALRYEF
ncbi:autotransporter outer membrane beta-barrel domain-containing protein [Aliamphritea spongicola]|nr:autotransporter outer membrane beta-barrel domain-containing protein [Aliamphritea spongicola]